MLGIGYAEILVILFLGLLLFGKHLPGMANWLGRSVLEFRKETRDLARDLKGSGEKVA